MNNQYAVLNPNLKDRIIQELGGVEYQFKSIINQGERQKGPS